MFFALKGENFNGNAYAEEALKQGAKFAIVDEVEFQTSENIIFVKDCLKALQELATFHRFYLKTPIVALTGSNGKTTTKELINAVLSQKYKTTATVGNLNNHIGVPLTLLSMTPDTELGIVEMGANHQKEIEFLCSIAQPDFGLITNYGKAHLEGFGGVAGIIKGKSEMYDYLKSHEKTAFVNAEDPIQMEKTEGINRFTFGNSNQDVPVDFKNANPFVRLAYNGLEIQSQLIGDYNFTNIAFAVAMGHYFKVDKLSIKHAIESYVPSNNRSQIKILGTNKIILDAYNANPTSMRAALLNLSRQSGSKMAFLGDMFELGEDALKEHQNIEELANSLDIEAITCIGKHFSEAATTSNKISHFKTFEAFKQATDLSNLNHKTILIKGSRGMAMERLLDLLPE
ncbi:UDP-N-acetylmuramoyl-tripeptide--D-alanyl-D-alanine ligase [Gaetbulibacter aestuarii]